MNKYTKQVSMCFNYGYYKINIVVQTKLYMSTTICLASTDNLLGLNTETFCAFVL